jgi:iron complex outermembrane receptor protein
MDKKNHGPARLAWLACLLAAAAQAQDPAASVEGTAIATDPPATSPASVENATFAVGPVEVTADAIGPLPTSSLLTSVDVLGSDTIDAQRVHYTWELFNLMPGTILTNFNQGTTSGKFSFRGFNGEGEINAVKLLIDGIPSNSNDGNMPYLDAVFPLDIESIETVRGTNDPRYGLHNIAGNANLRTRLGGTYAQGLLSYGSFDTFDAGVSAGYEAGGWTQNYFVGYRSSEGWRDHSDSDKYSIAGKWFYTSQSGNWRSGLTLRHFEHDAQEPGYLTYADSRDDPDQSYAFSETDGGEREITQAALHLDTLLSDQLSWSVKSYLNLFEDRRFVKFSAAVSQQERYADERQIGLLSSLTWRPQVSRLHALAIEAGFDVERQDNVSERYLTLERVRQSQTRDQHFDQEIYGVYAQAIIKPTARLTVVPAYRIDWVNGSFENQLNDTQYPINHYGAIHQPKISIIFAPTNQYSVYANWGRTFQIGVGAGAYKIPPRTTDLDPSINDGWEVGLKFVPTTWLDGRVAYWQQSASDEVRRKLNDPLGDFDNLGETKRKGVDVQANLRPTKKVELWIAYAFQDAEIVDPGPTNAANAGNQIDHVPHHVFTGGVNVRPMPPLRLSAWASAQSDYYLEQTNSSGKFGEFLLFNASASYQFTPRVSVDVQLRNITDEYTEYVWWDGTQTLHSPGPGRSAYASLTVRF